MNNDTNNKTGYNSNKSKLLSEKRLDKKSFSASYFAEKYDINIYDYNAINNKIPFIKEINKLFQENNLYVKKCKHNFMNNAINNTTNEIIHYNFLKNNKINKNENSNFRFQNDIKKKKNARNNINSILNQKYNDMFILQSIKNTSIYNDKNDVNKKIIPSIKNIKSY